MERHAFYGLPAPEPTVFDRQKGPPMTAEAPQPTDLVKEAYASFVSEYKKSRPAEQIFSDKALFNNATLAAFYRYMKDMKVYYESNPEDAKANERNVKTVLFLLPVLKQEDARRKMEQFNSPSQYLSSYINGYLPNFKRQGTPIPA